MLEGKKIMDLSVVKLTGIEELEAAVVKGAAYLDSRYAGWRWQIDPETVESNCPIHSVVGQLFGPFLADQMSGVGIDPDFDQAWKSVEELVGMGFAVMAMTPTPPTDALLIAATAMGLPIPDMLAIPRDPDVVAIEAETLTHLWQKEINKR